MQNDRKRILTMLENGTITTDEALTLLEKLPQNDSSAKETSTPVEHTETPKKTQENTYKKVEQDEPEKEKEFSSKYGRTSASAEEFMEDIRQDLTNVGDQFMQFMQSAVQKVKEFDMENPFGAAVTFEHSVVKDGADIKDLIVDIDNGKLSIVPGESDEISATFAVKAFTSSSVEEAKQEFMDKLICTADDQSFRISSNSKTVQVNTTLTVPKKAYHKISVRLLNGGCEVRNLESELVRVKTANGKVNLSYFKASEIEIETLNGEIRLLSIDSTKLDAQTVNGLIYIDGKVKETEARTLNGAISVTTTHEKPEKVDVKSVGGSIELYVPSQLSLVGSITSTIGSLSLKLPDVEKTSNQDPLLHRSINFKTEVSESASKLHLFAESKTGSVLVCYNPEKSV